MKLLLAATTNAIRAKVKNLAAKVKVNPAAKVKAKSPAAKARKNNQILFDVEKTVGSPHRFFYHDRRDGARPVSHRFHIVSVETCHGASLQ